MTTLPPAVIDAVETYVLDREDAAIQQLLQLAVANNVAAVDLLSFLSTLRGDAARKRQAITAVRRHFGLPLIPGPPCRT